MRGAEGTQARSYSVDGRKAEKADFLFVVDPSVSMMKVLKDVRAGIQSLEPTAFGKDTRIAVMTTTPASADGSQPHPAVADVEGALRDPGFQRLIRGRDIAAWKGRGQVEEACGDGWFAPTDTLPDGTPCLDAITTLPLYPARAEAGLVAFKQFLERQGDEPLFRDGAAVNVVFISDTHDPGIAKGPGFDALNRMRPDYEELAALVDRANVVSSFRVHAIAPMEGCVAVEDFSAAGTTYYDVALASGGRIIDVCKANDYSAIFSDLIAAGSVPTAGVVDLGAASEVVRVEVNGEEADFTVHRGGRLVKLDQKLSEGANDVRVYTR